LPHLINLYLKYHKSGLEILAVSEEPVDQLKAFATAKQIPFPVLSDPRREAHNHYGVNGLPFNLLIDRRGNVAAGLNGYLREGFEEAFATPIEATLKGG
jgi:peroxiredoxin